MKFEDLHLGQEFLSHSYTVSREEIVEFARRWDPQPLHLDEELASGGLFGGVVASGFMTTALAWRLWVDLGIQGEDGRGGIGIEGLRWSKPLVPDTTVQARIRLVERRITSKGFGLVTYELRLCDAGDDEIVRFRTTGLVARRQNVGEPVG